MRARLKGLHAVRKRLADGSIAIYHYAWRGGPRLAGQPGTPEFAAAYKDATAATAQRRRTGTLQDILDAFQDSETFRQLAPRTRKDYAKILRGISNEFGDFPLAALVDRKARGDFLAWRDGLAKHSRRHADYAWSVLARTFSWALDRGLALANPCERGGKLYHGSRGDRIWTEENEAAFMRLAPGPLRLAMTLALWTGQRQGDLLRLPWSAYDGQMIRLKQGKTGARVAVPVGAPLRAALDTAKKRGPLILTNSRERPWTSDGFRTSWHKACAAAGISGVTFHDLRGTAVLRLFLAGCTVAEIATITGHGLRDVQVILDSNYFHRDVALAQSAIAKLEIARSTRTNKDV